MALKASEQVTSAIETLTLGTEIATKNDDLMPANEMQNILQSLK